MAHDLFRKPVPTFRDYARSHRGQSDDEASAQYARLAAAVRSEADAVLSADASTVRLDDLARNGKPEAGILSEPVVRPVGVEAIEDFLERVRANAGPVVVDHDGDLIAPAPARDAHDAAFGRERARVVDQIVEHLGEAGV